jgi:hypothetical protein
MQVTIITRQTCRNPITVSLGVGTAGQTPTLRGKIRLAAHFGIFQSGRIAPT